MELYTLDRLLRRETVIDVYESLVWTERWAAYGDFELVIGSTPATRRLFTTGTRLALNESYRVMTVETVESNTDAEGKSTLNVKGSSLERLLEDRVATQVLAASSVTSGGTTTERTWDITGTPMVIANTMFNHICRTGALDLADQIPFLQSGSIFTAGNIPAWDEAVTLKQSIDNLYNAVKGICDLYDMGFRLVRNFDESELYFDVYTGNDRTTGQTVLPPVVFSPTMENLQNTTEFSTIEASKNVAYVFSDQGFEVVYPLNIDPNIEGFERRILVVKADALQPVNNVQPTTAQISAYLIQRGLEELAANRGYSAFDGEIGENIPYKYNVHYNMGDLVEQRNVDGVANNMRVTEQIFASDSEGERAYPTLTAYQYVTPGAWISWAGNQTWADYAADPTTWVDLP